MERIASYIARGALAFLKAEWRVLAVFAVIVAGLLGVFRDAIWER
jgi:K(+)-stimulated pyrophosphate-energized sodium pump